MTRAVDDLAAVVAAWDTARVAEKRAYDDDQIPRHVAMHGTVLLSGATEEQLRAAEERLGVSLPPSYRAFLAMSNGAHADGVGLGIRVSAADDPAMPEPALWPCERIDWAGRVDRRLVDMWATEAAGGVTDPDRHPGYDSGIAESRYLDHAAEQDPVHFKPGHLRHALQISRNVDGYALFLNPLVGDSSGEWEVLDFGTKAPGAFRYATFRDFLADRLDSDESMGLSEGEAADRLDTALDQDAPAMERMIAVGALMLSSRRSEAVVTALVDVALDSGADTQARRMAIHWMRSIDDPRVVDVVERLIDTDAGAYRSELLPVAASLVDPRAGEVLRALLRDPGSEGRLGFIYRDLHGALLDLYHETGRPDLLKQALQVGDQRALPPAMAAMAEDPASTLTSELAVSLYRIDISGHFSQIVEVAMRDGAPHHWLGVRLAEAGAGPLAVPVLARSLDEANPVVDFCDWLGEIGTPEALHHLVAATQHPSGRVRANALIVLARVGADVVASAEAAIGEGSTTLAAIDALEIAGTAGARDALLAAADSGIAPAMRALGRLGDERVLELAVDMLERGGPGADQAAEALRDLRHPEAVAALAEVLGSAVEGDIVTIAAHALAMIGGPGARDALRRLDGADEHLRRLIDRWVGQLAGEEP